jgi:hypothetical protein
MLTHQRETVTVGYPVLIVDLFVVLTHAGCEVDGFSKRKKERFRLIIPAFASVLLYVRVSAQISIGI